MTRKAPNRFFDKAPVECKDYQPHLLSVLQPVDFLATM
jgi:hypothetical protein